MSPSEEILFFNTLIRKKELFVPLTKKKVKMYTCGPTVYDFAHIGNFRTFIFQDLLRRWLEYNEYEVTQIMNLTDVDDKTIKGSKKTGISLKEYTEKYTKAFFEDIAFLNIQKAKYYPKATEHITEMVTLILKLMEKGYAYRGEEGSIYFDISKFKDYGHLSNVKLNELKSGTRVRVDEYGKEEARDFVLWKTWTEQEGDVFWETDIGKGRPGWHIECSTMAMQYLGKTIDIHSGGVDLIFPHHENEIAQSEAVSGKNFVNYWLHSEHLLVEGKRMAKSSGNFYTLRALKAKGYDSKSIRYLLLSTHYRQQFNFTFDGIDASKKAVERLMVFTSRLIDVNGEGCGEKITNLIYDVKKRFEENMNNDLNIGAALAVLFDFVREVNKLLDNNLISRREAEKVYKLMMNFDKLLGIIGELKEKKLSKEAFNLINQREKARKEKNWKKADEIRANLRKMGIIIEDTPQGVKWRMKNKKGL